MTGAANGGHVERLYQQLKAMAVNYTFKPDERINETALTSVLGSSRTPIREALNRLVAEDLLTYRQGKGFFCRPLRPKDVVDLYEARLAVEQETIRLACERAKGPAVIALIKSLEDMRPGSGPHEVKKLVERDETFHLDIARLSGNNELVRMLKSINLRIRFVRWIDMEGRREITYGEHVAIANAILAHDATDAVARIKNHLTRRAEEIAAVVREGYSRIYVPNLSAEEGSDFLTGIGTNRRA